MKKYYCECCNYETDIKCNYEKHLLTKKHIMIISRMKNNEKTHDSSLFNDDCDGHIIQCKYCSKKFKHASSLSRHIKHICKKYTHHNDHQLYVLNKESYDIQLEIDKLNKKLFDVTKT
mgnify:CR=1 FL=1|tara:strand:- start:472 stop:825 length:354 start_codon:yes stop_codon:yes gene_type:complete